MVGLFPHVCQGLYQKDVLTLVQQVLDVAHRALCAQTHVLDVGLTGVCGPERCGWGGAGLAWALSPQMLSHTATWFPGLAPTGESLPVL